MEPATDENVNVAGERFVWECIRDDERELREREEIV